MGLESVWESLECERWKTKLELEATSGIDDDTFTQILSFLDRWGFVEIQRNEELLVRRRSSTISPIETFHLLGSIAKEPLAPPNTCRVAERVACRACGAPLLNFIGNNEVECVVCHEKQWYALERPNSSINKGQTNTPLANTRSLQKMLIRLVRRQNHP